VVISGPGLWRTSSTLTYPNATAAVLAPLGLVVLAALLGVRAVARAAVGPVAGALVAMLGLLALFATSGPAVAFFSGGLFLDVQVDSPARLLARGAAIEVPLEVTCNAVGTVDVQVTVTVQCSEPRPSRRAPPSQPPRSSAATTSPAAARQIPRSSTSNASLTTTLHMEGCRRGHHLAAAAS
jgi:uncharacterized protein (DUF58 family)